MAKLNWEEARSQQVWAHSLEEEFDRLRDAVEEGYRHVAMDALLPGIVVEPCGPFGSYAEYNYQTLKRNVDMTRVIQVGLTLLDDQGNQPAGVSTWRFNFAFDVGEDQFALPLIDKLRQRDGLDLAKHSSQGIATPQFGELLMSSGLVLNEDMLWISFCGADSFFERPAARPNASGEPAWITYNGFYNFGYMLQILTAQPLPEKFSDFQESLDLFFPNRCDIARHFKDLSLLTGRDHSDPLDRPLYCNGHCILDAFFHLPGSVRRTVFECTEEPPCGKTRSNHRNGRRKRHDRTSKNAAPAQNEDTSIDSSSQGLLLRA